MGLSIELLLAVIVTLLQDIVMWQRTVFSDRYFNLLFQKIKMF